MPGTYRYSATFDRTYEEETPPSSDSRSRPKTRQPSYGRSLSDYGCHRRSTSTDSLDSMCGSSCSSTGHSRQVSADSTEYIPTRMITKASARPAHNPLQFVKVNSNSSALFRQSQEQKKTETKPVKEKIKDDEEEWQSNLDSWKSRRRKQSEGSLQRLEEIRKIELEEQQRQLEQKKIRTKTFSEMMEERAHRPKQYNLLILGRPTSEDEMKSDEDISSIKSDTNEDNDKTSNEEVICNKAIKNNIHNGSHLTENGINNNFEKVIQDKNTTEKTNANGGYTNIDSGLDSLSSSHKAGDIADSASDFSQDSGSSLDSDFQHTTGSLTTGVELLEEFSSSPLSNYERKTDDGMELFLRIWLKQGNESKDFGFNIKEGKDQNPPVVSTVFSGGVGDLAGLRKGDQVLAINGEYTQGHDHDVIQFALQQAVYVGHLDLLIWRSTNKDTKDSAATNGMERERSNSLISQRKFAFENGSQEKKGVQKTNKDIKSAVNFKEKVSSFERRSSTENSSSLTKSLSSRKPPPVPNKPRLRSKSVPDANFFLENSDYRTLSDNDSKSSDEKEIKSDLNVECIYNSQCSNDLDQQSINSNNQENLDSKLESKDVSTEVTGCIEKHNINTVDDDDDDDHDTKVCDVISNCNGEETNQPQRLVNLNPIYQDSGLNIIYDSHPTQDTEKTEEKNELPINIEQPLEKNLQSVKMNNEEQRHTQTDTPSDNNGSSSNMKENLPQSFEERKSAEETKNEESPEELLKLQYDLLNSDIYQLPLNLNQDDLLLADLDASPRQLEPPKEKPPPPPLDESDIEHSEKLPTTRHNSTKEIKRELWKRRSNFLGIEFEDGAIEIDENQIPPPLAMEDILKSERELEREKRQLLEEQTLLRLRRLAEEEEIARKEREIIENIEREERERQQQELEARNNNSNEENLLNENTETNKHLKEQHSEKLLQDKEPNRFQECQVLQEREEYVKQQEDLKISKSTDQRSIKKNSGSKQSNSNSNDSFSSLSSNNSAKFKSEEAKSESVLPNRTPSKKMILRQERERLRREQEALQKQREEYERQIKYQQQKWLQQQNTTKQKHNNSTSLLQEKVPNKTSPIETASSNSGKDELLERDDIIYASRQPQAAPPQSDDLKLKNEGNELPNNKLPLQSQALSKRSLHSLGAAPKAKIVNNEKWIKPNEKDVGLQ